MAAPRTDHGQRGVDDAQGACRQLELQVALARLDGVAEGELRRLVGVRLALGDESMGAGMIDVDVALGDCLRWSCDTQSIWQAFEFGLKTGSLMIDVYRDGFVEGYRDALGGHPVGLAAE